jgi:hypothetical protein
MEENNPQCIEYLVELYGHRSWYARTTGLKACSLMRSMCYLDALPVRQMRGVRLSAGIHSRKLPYRFGTAPMLA